MAHEKLFRILNTVESRFLEPPDNSNQLSFPLDLLHSNTVILPPISRTIDYSKLPQTRTNFRLPWETFPENYPP